MSSPEIATIVVGSILGVVVICGTIAFFYLYFYFKRNKRFPWQDPVGTVYCPPVANYHEIEEIRANEGHAYDYAVVEGGGTQVIVRNKDRGEYDHLGEKIKFAAVRYDTTASTVQIIASAGNSGVDGEPVYTYDRLGHTSNPEVAHNKYEVVEVVESTPRSPTGHAGASPNYNFLAVPKPEAHLSNDYDKPSVQGHPSNEHEAEEDSIANSLTDTREFGRSSCNMSDEQKSTGVIGNMDPDEFVETTKCDHRGENSEIGKDKIYQLASAMDIKKVNKTKFSTYEDAQSLGGRQEGCNTLPKKPRVLKRDQGYDLATLPSRKKKTTQEEEKLDKNEKKNLLQNVEKPTPRSRPMRSDNTGHVETEKRSSMKVENSAETNPAFVLSASISKAKPEKPIRASRQHSDSQLSSKPKSGEKPSIIPRRTVSTKK